jgi:hypothetical protein
LIRSPLRFAEQALPSPAPVRSWSDFWDWADARKAMTGQPPVPRPTGHNPDVTAYARVDDGRWIADCPWGCGAAFNLPAGETVMWCTECAGAGLGHTAALVWPADMERLTHNLESWPGMIQFWPCHNCMPLQRAGLDLCNTCRGLQGAA